MMCLFLPLKEIPSSTKFSIISDLKQFSRMTDRAVYRRYSAKKKICTFFFCGLEVKT